MHNSSQIGLLTVEFFFSLFLFVQNIFFPSIFLPSPLLVPPTPPINLPYIDLLFKKGLFFLWHSIWSQKNATDSVFAKNFFFSVLIKARFFLLSQKELCKIMTPIYHQTIVKKTLMETFEAISQASIRVKNCEKH